MTADTKLPAAIPGYGRPAVTESSPESSNDTESLEPFVDYESGASYGFESADAPISVYSLNSPSTTATVGVSAPVPSAANAGVFWYCWEGNDYNELVCDWGEGEEYCYYYGSDFDGDWYQCGDGCYIIDDGWEYWRWCECPPGYVWDDWWWDCVWDEETFQLNVSGSGSGSGSVSSNLSGIDCEITSGSAAGSCSEYYPSIETVTLSASPAEDNTFSGWSGACSGSGNCNVEMSQARNVTATFAQLPPPSFQVRCDPPNGINRSVVRMNPVDCAITTSDNTVTFATGNPFTFSANVTANSYGISDPVTENTTLLQGFLVTSGQVDASVDWTRASGATGTASAAPASVTATARGTGAFPTATQQDVVTNPGTPTEVAFTGSNALLGEAWALYGPGTDSWTQAQAGGINAGFTVPAAIPYAVTFQYSINYTRLTALHNLADTNPTDGSCSKAQVQTLEAVVRAHEGGAYETGSHTRAGRDYISSANMLTQIRTRAEASVTVWPVTQDANQWLRGNVLSAPGLDAAMGATHAGAAAHDAVTYMANTFGCTLRQ